MSELNGRGLPSYSRLGFGEALAKVTRHKITRLCIRGLEAECKRINNERHGRGRPIEPIGVLSHRMGVDKTSIGRWMDLKKVQANDANTERLSRIAYQYFPDELGKILKDDIALHAQVIHDWFDRIKMNNTASPCRVNSLSCPYCDETLPDEDGLNRHIITLHKGRQAEEGD